MRQPRDSLASAKVERRALSRSFIAYSLPVLAACGALMSHTRSRNFVCARSVLLAFMAVYQLR
jgi:hypothetical protein